MYEMEKGKSLILEQTGLECHRKGLTHIHTKRPKPCKHVSYFLGVMLLYIDFISFKMNTIWKKRRHITLIPLPPLSKASWHAVSCIMKSFICDWTVISDQTPAMTWAMVVYRRAWRRVLHLRQLQGQMTTHSYPMKDSEVRVLQLNLAQIHEL